MEWRKHQLKEFDSQNCCKQQHCLLFSGHNQDKNALNLCLQRKNTTILMPLNVQKKKMGFPKGTEFYISQANLALANLTLLVVSAMLQMKVCPRLLSTGIYEVVSCRDFILHAVATVWAMSLVGIYPGRASYM